MISYLPTILSFLSCALASKTYKYLPIYLGRYLHNKREIAEIMLTRQENFVLVKEVLKHFVIISEECKSRIVASTL
jgi:hypothetical protein